MRLLITGASGDLGRPLSRLAAHSHSDVYSTYFRNQQVGGGTPHPCDLRDWAAVEALIAETQPNVIIHAAVSDRSSDMVNAHRLSGENITRAARLADARLIALSTDMVFDGTVAPYSEDDPPAPVTQYGRAKAESEAIYRDYENTVIVRTSLIYDFDPANRQLGWMLQRIDQGETIPLFTDEIRSPIWAVNLAEVLLELATLDFTGILHVTGPTQMSRWDYGRFLLKAHGLEPDPHTEPGLAAEIMPQRPRDLTLNLTRARSLLSTPLLSIEAALSKHRKNQGHVSSTTTSR